MQFNLTARPYQVGWALPTENPIPVKYAPEFTLSEIEWKAAQPNPKAALQPKKAAKK